MSDTLFELPPVESPPVRTETCGQCIHIQRWECGGSFFHYCRVTASKRTDNGLLKVLCKRPVCWQFEAAGLRKDKP